MSTSPNILSIVHKTDTFETAQTSLCSRRICVFVYYSGCQDFLRHPVLSGAWGGRWPVVVGRLRGAPGACRWSAGRCCLWPYLVSCGKQRALGRTLFLAVAFSPPSVPVVSVHRGDSAHVWDYLSDHWGGNYQIWTEERFGLVVIASVACFVVGRCDCPWFWQLWRVACESCSWVCGGFNSVSAVFLCCIRVPQKEVIFRGFCSFPLSVCIVI